MEYDLRDVSDWNQLLQQADGRYSMSFPDDVHVFPLDLS